MVEVIGSGKHSSLLQYGNNYCRKKFYSTGPRGQFKLKKDIYVQNLTKTLFSKIEQKCYIKIDTIYGMN